MLPVREIPHPKNQTHMKSLTDYIRQETRVRGRFPPAHAVPSVKLSRSAIYARPLPTALGVLTVASVFRSTKVTICVALRMKPNGIPPGKSAGCDRKRSTIHIGIIAVLIMLIVIVQCIERGQNAVAYCTGSTAIPFRRIPRKSTHTNTRWCAYYQG